MSLISLNDTIAAIATPSGESGIGIVRISGPKALSIADRIFVCRNGARPSDFKTYTTHYGWITEEQRAKSKEQRAMRNNIVDEVILTVMRAPKSYTREDIVEINCHGGIVPLRKILELVLDSGARLAKPGEFTQRAFLNGRIDLAQAEAVLDIVRAKTDYALKVSLEQLSGALSKRLNRLRDGLLNSLSILEANIDFPEEDLGTADLKEICANLEHADREISLLLEGSKSGRILRDGLKAVICGKPNAGKSSLFNALLKCERSIVTPIAGTTRDTVEEILDIKGIPVRIVDTAGIIEPRDLIEKKAVSRSRRYIREADLVLLVLDGSRELSYEDEILIRKTKSKLAIVLINKIDLRQKVNHEGIARNFRHVVRISAKKGTNLDLLEGAITRFVFDGEIKSGEQVWISNLRHSQQLKKVRKSVLKAKDSIKKKLPFELVAQNFKDAVGFLDEILGKNFSQDLLDRVFSEFCIGK